MKISKRSITHILVLFVIFSFIVSCDGKPNILKKQGLERNNLELWERRVYPKLGISVEMPKDVNVIRTFYRDPNDMVYGYNNLAFFIHPEYYGYVEPHYVISVYVQILNFQQYKNYKKQNHCLGGVATPLEDIEFYNKVAEVQVKNASPQNASRYRRDFLNEKNGSAVLAYVVYWEAIDKDPLHKPIDIETIKRILNSIKFLDEKEKK